MKFPASKMKLETMTHEGCYSDYEFIDDSPKGMKRLWILSVGTDGCETYSMLRRSETDESEFLDGVILPQRITLALRGLIDAKN